MAKRTLGSLDLVALGIALDHLEEHGPEAGVPDPDNDPASCVYLRYVGAAQTAALTARLPYVDVLFNTPAAGERRKIIRKVYRKVDILYILRFLFPDDEAFTPFVAELSTVSRRYWRVLKAE